jgi:hypothetical protein
VLWWVVLHSRLVQVLRRLVQVLLMPTGGLH